MQGFRARAVAVALVAVAIGGSGVVAGSVPPAGAGAGAVATTFEGSSIAAMYPSGLEVDAHGERLVIPDTPMDQILLYSLSGARLGTFGTGGKGPGQFDTPRDVAVDGDGNIYVADTANDRIQSFDADGNFRWLVSKSLSDGLRHPMGVTWDVANQQLIVAGTDRGMVTAWSGDGAFLWTSPSAIGVLQPRDAGRAPDGTVWVSDYGHDRIAFFDVTPAGQWTAGSPGDFALRSITGGSGKGDTRDPYNVAFSPSGTTMYLAATNAQVVSRFDLGAGGSAAVPLTSFGVKCPVKPEPCPDPPLPGSAGRFNDLRRVAVDPDGNVYAADEWGNGVEVFAPDGSHLRSIEGRTAPAPGVARPMAVDVGLDGEVVVLDRVTHRIERFDSSGTLLGSRGNRGSRLGFFLWPMGVTVGPDGTVWAIDTRNDRIERFSRDLAAPVVEYSSASSPIGALRFPMGADVDADGRVWIADSGNHRIVRFDPQTGSWVAFGSEGGANGRFRTPEGVAVMGDRVYVADTGNHRLQRLTTDGAFQGALAVVASSPAGVDVAPDGTVWVADRGHGQVLHVDSGLTAVLDRWGAPGDLDRPQDVAVADGSVLVADTFHSRIQRLVPDVGPARELDTAITAPVKQTVVTSPVSLGGWATAPNAVAAVRYSIRDKVTLRYLQPDGTFGAFVLLDASLTPDGPGRVTWSATAGLPPGQYGLDVRAVDSSGAVDPTHAFVAFTVR